MRPTLAALTLRDTTVEYLTTTFALAEPDTQDALEAFLTDPVDGLFRGPYLRIRRPFWPAADGWERHLEWFPARFRPYAHQAESFARLTGKDGHRPEPTLVTTGTGSGKAESFLIPVLDHCRRAWAAGKAGIKAVLLYPMNALAGDQAGRLGDLFERDKRLDDVTAGLYIGEASAARGSELPYGRVMVFGVRFPDDAVVGEDRRDIDEFPSPVDHSLPLPSPEELAGLPDPVRTPGGMDAVARATLGCDTADPHALGGCCSPIPSRAPCCTRRTRR